MRLSSLEKDVSSCLSRHAFADAGAISEWLQHPHIRWEGRGPRWFRKLIAALSFHPARVERILLRLQKKGLVMRIGDKFRLSSRGESIFLAGPIELPPYLRPRPRSPVASVRA